MSDTKIKELHAAYCQASGFDLPLRMGRDRAWFDFEKAGFTKEDLLMVIRWIKQQSGIKGSGYGMSSLRFSTLLQLDYFEEKLLLARQAFRRKPKPPAVVEQRVGDIRRQVETSNSSEPVIAGEAAAEILREWRQKIAGPSAFQKVKQIMKGESE